MVAKTEESTRGDRGDIPATEDEDSGCVEQVGGHTGKSSVLLLRIANIPIPLRSIRSSSEHVSRFSSYGVVRLSGVVATKPLPYRLRPQTFCPSYSQGVQG